MTRKAHRAIRAAVARTLSNCAGRQYFVEALERRMLLAAVYWDGGGDGTNWTSAANWSTDSLPGPADDVTISVPSYPTIQIASGTQTIHSLVSDEAIRLTGGTLDVATNLQVNNTFTIIGGTLAHAHVLQGNPINPFVPGVLNGTASFDGVNDNVSIPDPADNHLDIGTNVTMESWVRFAALPSNTFATILSKDQGSGNTNKWIFGYAQNYSGITNATMLQITSPSGGTTLLKSAAWTPVLGQWYHLALVKSGSDYTFYLNGVANGTASSAAAVPDVAAPLVIGQSEGAYGLNGSLDDVRFWSTARSASDIQSAMNSALSGSETGLSGYWRMDDGSGNVISDLSRYDSAGTFNNYDVTGFTVAGGTATFDSVTVNAAVNVTSGTLNISGNNASTINGSLTFSGSSLAATAYLTVTGTTSPLANLNITTGAGAVVTLPTASLTAVNLTASGGSQLLFPVATSYTGYNYGDTTIQATGVGSKIDLSHLTSFKGGGYYYNSGYDYNSYTTHVKALTGGEVDLAGAVTVNSNGRFNDIVLDNTGGVLGVTGIVSIAYSTMTISGGQALSFDNVASLTAVNLTASGGSQLLFPVATSYTGYNYGDTTIQATGVGSKIDLSHLTSFKGGGYYYNSGYDYNSYTTHVKALTGGEVDLAGAVTVNSNGKWNDIQVNGDGSLLGVAGITQLNYTTLTVGTTPGLTFSSVTSLTGVNLSASAGITLMFPVATTLTAVNLTASGGSQLLFPVATSYTGYNYGDTTIQATGVGSKIDLSHLTSFKGGGYYYNSGYDYNSYTTHVKALTGGEVDLAGAVTVNSNGRFNDIVLDNTGGVLGVTGIVSIAYSTMTISGGQALSFDNVASLTAVNLTASGGSQLLFPVATSYTGYNYGDTTIQATGVGSKIDLSHLTSFKGGGYYYNSGYDYNSYTTHVKALTGGEVDLAGALGGNPSGGYGNDMIVDGSVSALGLGGITVISTTALTAANGATWTFPAGTHPTFGGGCTLTTSGTGSGFLNLATLSVSGVSLAINTSAFINQGILDAQSGGTFDFNGSFRVDDPGILSGVSTGIFTISGNLLGNTTNADRYAPQPTVRFDGATGAATPQMLEVMSEDVLTDPAGFNKNFVYGMLSLSGTNTYVKLVDQSDNALGTGAEALYVNSIIIPTGTTLDLNGYNVYTRAAQVTGTIDTSHGGTFNVIPDSGPLAIATPTPGAIDPLLPGQLDEWTFYGRAGRYMTVVVNPGTGSPPAPVSPQLNWVHVKVVAPDGTFKEGDNSSSGAVLELKNIGTTTDGLYHIFIKAPTAHISATGNYIVTAWDATPNIQTLNLNQRETGAITTPYGVDQWNFSAAKGTLVRFNLLGTSASGLVFSLTGPNGFVGFTNISGTSSLVNLTENGQYTLTANGGGAIGSYSFEMVQYNQTALPLGTTFNGNFTGSGQAQLFTVAVTAGQPLAISLTDPSSNDHTEVYASFGLPPTRETHDYADNSSGPSHSLLVPNAMPGTWFILVYAESVPTPDTFLLVARSSKVILTGVTPDHYGANNGAVLTITGAGFDSTSSVELISGATTYSAASVSFDTFTQLRATFNLTGVPQGTYSVRVTRSDGPSDTLASAFTVTPPGQANLQTKLILPAAMGYHVSSTIYVQYSNTGTAAMPSPILLLESSYNYTVPFLTMAAGLQVAGYWTSAQPQGYSPVAQILASGKMPGVLEPGESVTVPVYYAGMQQPWTMVSNFKFDLRVFTTTDSDPADWASLKSSLQPTGVPNAAWNTIYSNLTSQLGTTWGGYVQMLDNQASYLGQLGENVNDIGQLWGFAVQQADNALNPIGPYLTTATDDALATPGNLSLSFSRAFASTIYGRDIMGPLGMGWSTPWQTKAAVSADGTVTISGPAGAQRIFQPDSRTAGAYFSMAGDSGTLRGDGNGGYLLIESDGTASDYASNGLLNYLQDANSNRITAGYTSGRLTSLTSTSGASLTIVYNAANLISSITDSLGRTVTYTYDASNQYLLSVTDVASRTTNYAYNTTSGAAAQNALTSITYPGNTHQYYNYDSEGKLAGVYQDNGSSTYTFAYALGQVSVANLHGDTSNLYFNEQGLVAKVVDRLGNVTLGTYDNNYNLTGITNALGQSESYRYNAAGEVTLWTDFLGNQTSFGYSGPFNALSSITDANGNATKYSYNASGDLLKITYANSTSESFSYDPLGNATSFINANGQPTHCTYNAAGQLTGATFADGSQYAYTYDAVGHLLTAQDAAGVIQFTYDSTTGDLTKVTYPNGTFLAFTYNAAGQRTQMVDQTSFTTTYAYDSNGWLSQLTDGQGKTIVTYSYRNCGLLKKKVSGNGTYTTYDYDADGHLTSLVNYAPNDTVNSRFDYTYNALGLQTGETTLDGAWAYTYDADGQLVHAVFASRDPASIPNQDLAYSYDALGNRKVTVINGVTTTYVTNNMNQYTSVGGVACTYDPNGNLLTDGTNTYTYNSLNELTGVVGPSGTTNYIYNALGQLASSTTNGQTTQYLIDPAGLGNVVGTYNGSGGLIADYTYGLGLTSQVTTGGTSYYYDFDALGSTTGMSNSTGGYVNEYSYLPFGESLSSTAAAANPFQFVGQYGVMAQGNGLDYMRARYYQPTIGRFISKDPLGLGGGDVNLYKYVGNATTFESDPVGLSGPGDPTCILQKGGREAAKDLGKEVWKALAGNALDALGNLFTGKSLHDIGNASKGNAYTKMITDLLNLGNTMARQFGGGIGGNVNKQYKTNISPTKDATSTTEAATGGRYNGELVGNSNAIAANNSATTSDGGGEGSGGSCSGGGSNGPTPGPGGPGGQPAPMPTPPGGGNGGDGGSGNPARIDPNALLGPSGYGLANFIQASNAVLPYKIEFENAAIATAPAQQVTVTDKLSSNLDWSTFQLTGIGWGDFNLTIPTGSQHYQATVPMSYNGQSFDVEVEAGIHISTGQVYATFLSIDPATSLPPYVLTGFLPPENGTGRGQGYISYLVAPKSGLATGTQITNVALISFDAQPQIATNQVDDEDPGKGIDPAKQALVTIDSGAPVSRVLPLPSITTLTDFNVPISASDDLGGSGVANYDIYVSDNGGAFALWLDHSTDLSPVFHGLNGHTYTFYSIARDNVGNTEVAPGSPDAITVIGTTLQVASGSFAYAAPPNALNFQFNGDVSGSLDTGDLVLVNLTTGLVVPASAMSLGYDAATNTGTFTFPGYAQGKLPDGNYRATLESSGITDDSGNVLDGDQDGQLGGDYALDFFQFSGDANHDRAVDIKDLYAMSSHWQQTGMALGQGDFNGDGTVDSADLSILAKGWQTTLLAVTPPTVTASNFKYLTGPQAVDFTFNTDVSASASISDLVLLDLKTGLAIPTVNISLSYDSGTNTAIFTFPGYTKGILPDGNYRATLGTASVNDTAGTPLTSPFSFDFFVLGGDANCDRTVNSADQDILSAHLGQPGNFAQGDFNYDGTVDSVDQAILTANMTKSLPNPTPPVVITRAFNYLSGLQSVTLKFSVDVSASLTADDLVLQNLTSGQTIPAAKMSVNFDPVSNIATFTFPGYTNGQLPDGNYEATLPAGAVADATGSAVASAYSFSFFVLGGDINRDRVVDGADLSILSKNWQQSSRSYAQGDLNGDGVVDIRDLFILATNFHKSLSAPSPTLPVPAVDQAQTPRRTARRVTAQAAPATSSAVESAAPAVMPLASTRFSTKVITPIEDTISPVATVSSANVAPSRSAAPVRSPIRTPIRAATAGPAMMPAASAGISTLFNNQPKRRVIDLVEEAVV